MKIIILSLIFLINLFGAFEDVNTFKANFKQVIINEQNKTIEYEGEVYIKKPNFAFWEYKKPVIKQVYLIEQEVTIVEPELEQIIFTKVEENIDFLQILKNAKKTSSQSYEALIKDERYFLFMENNLLKKVQFNDKMDNKVSIEFFNQQKNVNIEDKIFIPLVPEEFDIIKE